MKNMRSVFFVCVSAFLIQSAVASDELSYRWLPHEESSTQKRAKNFLASSELPDRQTSILSDHRFVISDDYIVERVRRLDFFSSHEEANENGSEVIYLDPAVESLTILEAGSIDSQGMYQRIDVGNIRVMDDNTYDAFGDTKDVVIPVSGLKEDSIRIIEFERKTARQKLESLWGTTLFPVLFHPVREFRLSVVHDDSNGLNWSSTDDSIVCEKNDLELVCEGKNLPGYPSDEGVIWRDVLGQIHLSIDRDWDAVIEHSLGAFHKSANQSDAVKSQLHSIVNEYDLVEEKISAVFRFAARDIRYVSLSELGNRITPHASASVLKNRFGDCKDKSALLVGMLRELGFDAYPVLVATERTNLEHISVPSMHYFDHMVACFEYEGETYCLDATDQSTSWKSMATWIGGRVALSLRLGDKPSTLGKEAHLWRAEFVSDSTILSDGGIRETQTRDYLSGFAGSMRNSFAGLSDEEINDVVVDQYQSQVSDTVEPDFEFEGLKTMTDRLTIKSSVLFPPSVSPETDLTFFEREVWLSSEILSFSLSTEHYDATVLGGYYTSTNTIRVDPRWKIFRSPPEYNYQSKWGSMSRQVELKSDTELKVTTVFDLPGQLVKRDEISTFNRFLDLLERESTISLVGELLE